MYRNLPECTSGWALDSAPEALDPIKTLALLARGNLADRPWGKTLAGIAARAVTGKLTVVGDDKRYVIRFVGGLIVDAESPNAADSTVRIGVTTGLLTATAAAEAVRLMGRGMDELTASATAGRLSDEQKRRLHRLAFAHKAARTFALERGLFELSDECVTHVETASAVEAATVIALGARLMSPDALSRVLGNVHTITISGNLAVFGFLGDELSAIKAFSSGAILPQVASEMGTAALCAAYAVITSGAGTATERPASVAAASLVSPASEAERGGPRVSVPPQTKFTTPPPSSASLGRTADVERKHATPPPTAPRRPPAASLHPPSASEALAQKLAAATHQAPHPARTTTPPPSVDTSEHADLAAATPPGPAPTFGPESASPRSKSATQTPRARNVSLGLSPTFARPVSITNSPMRAHSASMAPRPTGETSPPPPATSVAPPPGGPSAQPARPVMKTTPPMTSAAAPTDVAHPLKPATEVLTIITHLDRMLTQGGSYFELLGIDQQAPTGSVRRAYLELARNLHPDRINAIGLGAHKTTAQRVMAQINVAFATLTHAQRRQQYIELLHRGGAATVAAVDAEAQEATRRLLEAEEAFLRGESELRRSRFAEAIVEFTRAIELNPAEADHHAALGWALFASATNKQEAAKTAQTHFANALARDVKSVTAQFYQGRMQRILGNEAKALVHFRAVLARQPGHVDAAAEVRTLEARQARAKQGQS